MMMSDERCYKDFQQTSHVNYAVQYNLNKNDYVQNNVRCNIEYHYSSYACIRLVELIISWFGNIKVSSCKVIYWLNMNHE